MNILLCLLSGQHVPSLLSVHHYHPDRLVLVETDGMQKQNAASHFLKALKLGCLDYRLNHNCDVVSLQKEDSLNAMRETLCMVYEKHTSAQWTANITGGTKPMSIATFEFFKAVAGRVIYTNASRPATFLGLDSGDEDHCAYRLSLAEFLAGYGFEIQTKLAQPGNLQKRADCALAIARHASSQGLLSLGKNKNEAEANWKNARKCGWDFQPGQLRHNQADVAVQIAQTFNLTPDGQGNLTGRVDKRGVEFLTGGWLEEFFYHQLHRHAEALGIWDVRLNPKVGPLGDNTPNELDVAFMYNHALAIVECKSGAQGHDPGADILYKVEAVIRQSRALRVRSYLATTATNIFDPQKKDQLKESISNRAAIHNCRILTAKDIRGLAADADRPDTLKSLFFGHGE